MNTWKGLNSVLDPLIQTLFRIRVDRSPFQLDNKQSNQIRVERKPFCAARFWFIRSDAPPTGYEYLIRFRREGRRASSFVVGGLRSTLHAPCFSSVLVSKTLHGSFLCFRLSFRLCSVYKLSFSANFQQDCLSAVVVLEKLALRGIGPTLSDQETGWTKLIKRSLKVS